MNNNAERIMNDILDVQSSLNEKVAKLVAMMKESFAEGITEKTVRQGESLLTILERFDSDAEVAMYLMKF